MPGTSRPSAIRVDGLDKAIKALKSVGADKDKIREANVQAATTLANAARPLVPVYSGTTNKKNGKTYVYKSGGALQRTLRITKAINYAQVKLGNSKVQYANPIHFGWFYDKENFIEKNIRPNLFLYRALSSKKAEIMRDYDQKLQELLTKYNL